MKLAGFPFTATDWSRVEPETHAGTTGQARWRTLQFGDIRVRMVEYSPGYEADHWCSKGHVVLVIEGQITTRLADGREIVSGAGSGYQVADGAEAHRTRTEHGAKLFIVD
jgi:hypothetical protein